MTNDGKKADRDIRPTLAEIIVLCRTDLEVLYNLQYLFRVDAESPEKRLQYAELLFTQVKRLDETICGRLPAVLER